MFFVNLSYINNVFSCQELEQEKYHLRRRLEGVEEEYDLKVSELQTDITSLRGILQQTETNSRAAEREKSLLITQLTEQNQRLTSQLKDVSTNTYQRNEKHLNRKVK